MKTNKALKRLTKIEALLADVTEKYSASSPHVRGVLQDTKVAVARAKEAVQSEASSRTAKKSPAKHSNPHSKVTQEPPTPKRRISEEGMKRIIAATKERWRRQRAQAAKSQSAPATKAPTGKAPVKPVAAKKATTKTAPVKKVAAKTPVAARAVGQASATGA